MKVDILRITTISLSLEKLLSGQLKYMEDNGFKVATASHGKFKHEPHFEITRMRRAISPINDTLAFFQLVKVIRKTKPSIVHTHTPKAGLLGMMAARVCGVKHRLHTVAGLPLMEKTGIMQKILIAVERIIYASATHVFPNSMGLQTFIHENIYKGSKLQIIGKGSSNGIDTQLFSPKNVDAAELEKLRKETGIAETDVVFFFIGRMVQDKGIAELIQAFEQVQIQIPSAKLLLVGPLEPKLDPIPKATLQAIKEDPRIVSIGYVDDVKPYISLGDILCFPSYREGYPNVPMQAASFKKALILSDINGCNEMIEDGKSGFLVPTKTVEPLVKAMLKYGNGVELRKSHAQLAHQFIVNNLDQNYVWGEIRKVYKTLIG